MQVLDVRRVCFRVLFVYTSQFSNASRFVLLIAIVPKFHWRPDWVHITHQRTYKLVQSTKPYSYY